jgi:hypothetical protein
MILIFATPEEARELLGLSTRQPEILRPQTSGPCVHYDEQTEYAADAYPCTYPYGDEHSDGVCPHLDNPDILCPVKDACYAMSEVARMRDVCEAEQDEQDADMAARELVYETAAPEWVEPAPDDGALHTYTVPATRKPTNPNAWSGEEIEVIRRAQSAAEAGRLYVDAFPESNRTVAAYPRDGINSGRRENSSSRSPRSRTSSSHTRHTAPATGCGSNMRCTGGRPAKLSGISRRRRTTSSRSTGCRI